MLSERSKKNLSECHPDLQKVFNEVAKFYPLEVIEGHRSKELQDKVFLEGKSKTPWPESKHNKTPSEAADVLPRPINWNDKDAFYHFAGFVRGIAQSMGVKIRWGGDWNGNMNLKDQNFFDLPHFEIEK